MPVVGVLWSGPHGVSIGLTWQSETIPLHGTNAYSASVVTTFAGSSLDTQTLPGQSRYPHRVSLGVAWSGERLLLSAELVAYAGLAYPAPHQVLRTDLADDVHHELAHVDVSLAAEWALEPNLKLRFGAFTNTSSAAQQYIEERVNLFGLSLGVGLHQGRLDTSIGLVAQMGISGLQAETPESAPVAWRRVQAYVMFGGSHRFLEGDGDGKTP